MKRYDSYKDSGVEWIGEIPSHWECCRFKNFLYIKSEKSNSQNKVGLENIESQTGRYIITNTEFDGDGVGFMTGDILYGKLRPYLQKVWLSEFDGNAVGDFFVFACKPNSINVFVKYLMLSDCFTKEADGSTFGTKMPRVASEFILSLPFYLPPLNEQEAIANYLDSRSSKIDNVIATQKKRVELLRELKQSIITRAVTRGINPNAKMKDSGVEWIGEIPGNWKVARLKYKLHLINGRAYLQPEFQSEGKYKILRVGNLFTNSQWYYSDMELEPVKYCEKGDLLFAWSASFGPYIWKEEKVIYHYHIWKVLLEKDYSKMYAYYMLQALTDFKKADTHGSTMVHVTMESMNNTFIPVPSIKEQKSIVTYIEQQTSKLDSSINKALRQIELLKEYKQSLITEVVTGKRKVI